MVFLSINNHHGMTNCSSKLMIIGTHDSHVSDKVRNIAHLELLVTSSHSRRIIRKLIHLRIEVLKPLKRTLSLDLSRIVRNNQNSISVEVSTRQALCNFSIDTNSIYGILDQALSITIFVVNRKLRNLKCPTMG